jgi:endonuclease/exonuclease/phosphatase family metal-dependent hydrolase
MNLPGAFKNRNLAEIALLSILFLFFIQVITDFVEAIYAFGLLGTSLPNEMASVLFLFSPLLLLLLPKRLSSWVLVFLGELMIACRVVEGLLDTRGKMCVAGLGVACFLVLFPLLLWSRKDEWQEAGGLLLAAGLTLGLSLSILVRALDSGNDISTSGWFQVIGWALAIFAGVLLFRMWQPGRASDENSPPGSTEETGLTTEPAGFGFWRTVGLCLGLISVLVLCYFAFASPNVIARWTGGSYLLVMAIVTVVLCLFAFLLTSKPDLLAALTPAVVFAWNALLVLSMALTILGHQIRFPSAAGAYPLPEPPVTLLHQLPLLFMLVLFPIILIDFALFAQQLIVRKPSLRALGGGYTLASVYLLFMIFAQVFTTVYDYIPVVGPFFRDRFWLVYLLAGITLMLPLPLVSRDLFDFSGASKKLSIGKVLPGLLTLLALISIAGSLILAAKPAEPSPKSSLTILTYNIQQGYSDNGLKNYDGQLDLVRALDADIIGLQESDTNRIAGGNGDVVRYFADRLDLHSYYGPKTVPGTFGIALLSRVPIENPRTFYMYSEGEQTATIQAQITVGDKTFNVFVTHLGNGGPIVQQEAIIQELQDLDRVIAMGDFNFRPGSDQYRLTTATLDDSWLLRWPQGNDSQGVDPGDRIDHIFVSSGTRVIDSQYLPGPQSDHPAMTTTIEW